jgi:hypothetical protein
MSHPDQADNADGPSAAVAPVPALATEVRHSDAPQSVGMDFPVNWRSLAAAGDGDVEALLGRYDSPRAVARALKDLRTELSRKGTKSTAPGADATPEAVADGRRAHGVPARWQDYGQVLALPEAMVLGDADAPIVEGFFQAAHAANVPQAHVDAMLRWYCGHKERQEIDRLNADDEAREVSAAALRQAWGAQYARNVNLIAAKLRPSFAAVAPDLFDQLLLARMPDGRLVGDDAGMTRALLALALEIDPAARTAPGDSRASGQAGASRRAEIEAIMAGPDADTRYWGDPALQQEYRDLLAPPPVRPRRVA